MATHDIVVIGASAGGVEALSTIVSMLPRDLRAAVFVVLHVSRGRSLLPEILSRAGRVPAHHPDDGEKVRYGRIYVAPPDHHMTIDGDRVRVHHGPTENGVRPAADPLFRSAAREYGSRVIGVVLTGSLDDGTAGMAAVKEAGGTAIVQDPEEAFAPSMPRNVLEFVRVDHVLPVREIGVLLSTLTHAQAGAEGMDDGPHLHRIETDLAPPDIAHAPVDRPGKLAVYTCPECHGNLWETDDEGILRFRCRVGHVYTAESMLAAQTDSVDRALWAALRALEERVALMQRMSRRAQARRQPWVAKAFDDRARVAEDHANTVRALLHSRTAAQVVPDHSPDVELPEPVASNSKSE